MDSEVITGIYAQVVSGLRKDQSRFVTDEETSRVWDKIASEVDEMRKKNPKVMFDIPHEIPGRLDAGDDAPDESHDR